MRMDGRTYVTKLMVAFRNFANASKKYTNLKKEIRTQVTHHLSVIVLCIIFYNTKSLTIFCVLHLVY